MYPSTAVDVDQCAAGRGLQYGNRRRLLLQMVGSTVCSYSAERLVQITDIGHRYKATEAVTLSVITPNQER